MSIKTFALTFFFMALVGFSIGLGVGTMTAMHDIAVAYSERDEAIEAAKSLEASFNSLQKAFDSMKRTANRCIESQRR